MARLVGLLVCALAVATGSHAGAVGLDVGTIVVLDDGGAESGAPARLIAVDAATGTQSVVAELTRATGFDVAPNGDLLVADYFTDQIVRLDRVTQVRTVVATAELLVNPTHLVLGADGDLFVLDEGDLIGTPGDDAILRIDPGTGAQSIVVAAGGFGVLRGVAAAPNGALFVLDLGAAVAAGGDERIVRVSPDDGAQHVVLTGPPLVVPNDLFVRPDGLLVVADGDAFANSLGGILAVEPQVGTATPLSQSTQYSNPRSVVPVTGASDLWVLDAGVGDTPGDERLFRVEGPTGAVIGIHSENGLFVQPWQAKVLGEPTCGNDRIDFGEQCDDGDANGKPGSCCTQRCVVGSNGSACVDVRQVTENGVPLPAVRIACRLPDGVTKGNCKAKLTTVPTTAATVDAVAAAARGRKRVAVSKPTKAKIRTGSAGLRLDLNARGRQLLGASADGTLPVEARGVVAGRGSRAKIRHAITLRR